MNHHNRPREAVSQNLHVPKLSSWKIIYVHPRVLIVKLVSIIWQVLLKVGSVDRFDAIFTSSGFAPFMLVHH